MKNIYDKPRFESLRSRLANVKASWGAEARGHYPPGLRREVSEYLRDARKAMGQSPNSLGPALGIKIVTAYKWAETDTRESVPPPESEPARPALAITGPGGFRVEGLTFDQALTLMRSCQEPS
jgi:hypothetical protein